MRQHALGTVQAFSFLRLHCVQAHVTQHPLPPTQSCVRLQLGAAPSAAISHLEFQVHASTPE